jgi:hypothetical protein
LTIVVPLSLGRGAVSLSFRMLLGLLPSGSHPADAGNPLHAGV